MEDKKADLIIEHWLNLREKAEKDLAYLMNVQDIKQIIYAGYTPSFNDGDPCEQTTQYIGPPNCGYDRYFAYVDKNGKPKLDLQEYIDSEDLSDYIEAGLDPEVINGLKKWVTGEWQAPKELLPRYPLYGFDSFLWAIDTVLFPTDSIVLVTLNSTGGLSWTIEKHDCGNY